VGKFHSALYTIATGYLAYTASVCAWLLIVNTIINQWQIKKLWYVTIMTFSEIITALTEIGLRDGPSAL